MSTQTASTGTPSVTTAAPTMTLEVTESAVTEIKKFMAGEEGLPETAGLRVRVVPGGCSGFQYSLNIEERDGIRFHVYESKCDRKLRLRHFVYGVNDWMAFLPVPIHRQT